MRAIDSICYGREEIVEVKEGMKLMSGAQIIEGSCLFQLESPIEDCLLFKIAKQLSLAQAQDQLQDSGITSLLKTLSDHFVKAVIVLAIGVFLAWTAIIRFKLVQVPLCMTHPKIDEFCVWCFPFERAISVLVASCPCALGLAVPSVIIITLNLALQRGILVKKVP